ncbi:MAG: hypothetical protein ABEK04_03340 [Candidatus Nanohalobium sp.]
MDLKILAAVFLTLTAVFVVINAGGLQAEGGGMSGLSGLLSGFFSNPNPQPETEISADIKVLSKNTTINANGNLTVKGLNQYISENVDIKSRGDIKFINFNGKIWIGNTTKISGNVEGFTSNGVQVAKSFKLQKTVNTTQINVTGAERIALDFESANIDLEATNSSTSLRKTNTTVSINSFTGNMSVRPPAMEVELNGKINRLKAGSTTFGK